MRPRMLGGARRWPSPALPAGLSAGRPVLHRDPVLLALVASGLACALWFVLGAGDHVTQIRFFWLVQVPYDAALCVLSWFVSAMASGPTRRFWRVLTGSALLWTVGDSIQSVTVLLNPAPAGVAGGIAQTSFFTAGMVAVVVVMLMHPNAARSGRRRVAFWFDASTILTGGAALAWCFSVDPANSGKVGLVSTLIGVSVLLGSSYAAVKMVLGGYAPLTTGAAAAMISATLLQGISSLVEPVTLDGTAGPWVMVLRILPSILLVAGPRIQQLQAQTDPATFAPRPPKPYSLLPYAAIAATLLAELVVLPSGVTARLWGVVTGSILVTVLVVARQLVAFHDNVALIRQLDTTLVDLRQHERRLFEQASLDALTRLANRTVLTAEVCRSLATTGPCQGLALLLIDLDDFKTVNDTLGHPAGDMLLARAADVLRSATAATDVVARLGGDEFAVLLHDVDDQQALGVAERIMAKLAMPVQIDERELITRASIGLAMAVAADDQDSLLRNADIALYEAKDRGKGTCVRYAPDMGARIQETATLGAQLRQAVDSTQLFLMYQPIVRLADGAVAGAEALLRWRHPDRGLISPVDFIPLAERTGLIVPIGRWVLREACQQAAVWRRAYGRTDFVMSVNVAGRQLREAGFLDDVAAVLSEAGLPPACLTVEVTENAVLDDEAAIAALHGLRDLGVNLALDDFGTGASSLGLLLTCPVTILKLDRSFVESITTVSRQAAVARAVIEMATALQLDAVAEGIETAEQADMLRDLSYRYGQGYLFSRPLAAGDFTRQCLARAWSGAPADGTRATGIHPLRLTPGVAAT